MTSTLLIARGEWLYLWRTRLALSIAILLCALIVLAAVATGMRMVAEAQQRSQYQQQADESFRNQPDRHPHRVVHYGHYVFRVPAPLATLDPGVDSYTGRSIFLEGHRRNTATFSEARESSLLLRFGMVSPAFVLQTLAPLLLILIGFSSVARERERGLWAPLLAQGIKPLDLMTGKLVALLCVALLALSPMIVSALWIALRVPGEWIASLGMITGYALYLLLWCLVIVMCSAVFARARQALIALTLLWVSTTILLPRLAADTAASLYPTPTQAMQDIRIQQEMRTVGDSHNISDSNFQSFQDQVLSQYGVTRIEDLPVNYRGLVSLRGEAEGSAVMNRIADELHATQQQQSVVLSAFSWLSPYLALRQMSMQTAGTDLLNHQRFLDAAEAHRFELIQQLNTLHAYELDFADDAARSVDAEAEQRTRISAQFWQRLQDFDFAVAPASARVSSAVSELLALLVWVLLAAWAFSVTARKVGEV